jgi:putative addiction module killer protein
MKKLLETDTFQKWRKRLRDRSAVGRISARLERLAAGNAGDCEPVGEGVSELRIHHGPGYRVYFKQDGESIIILLCGGDKSSQPRDIATAKALAREWENDHG